MITTKGRYALRVLIDLAENGEAPGAGTAGKTGAEAGGGNVYVPLKDTAERQGISKKYLEIIVRDLVKGVLVSGASGKGGGYRLNRAPEEYSVLEVLETMEEPIAAVACLEKDAPVCPRAGECKTLPMWKEYDEMVRGYFGNRTIADLMK